MLRIYNTMTGKEEEFHPIRENKVGVYVCGVTTYDKSHIGHGRAAIAFDMVVRFLRYLKYDVTYVRNYTDIDDKIIQRAAKEGRAWDELAHFYCDEYARDLKKLGNIAPDIEPKATEHIPEMLATIQMLVDRGMAYAAGGDVYFAVRQFAGYGKLSKKKIEDLESGARVEVGESKRDPLDFALWKGSKPGEPKWSSPWGDGRPGWHIECSCMSSKYLGQPFDIHGGGRDLIFPHHENEIAQSEGALGCQFANVWMHNGTLDIGLEKMSKSLGNVTTMEAVLNEFCPEVVRYFLLSAHYRSSIDYTDDAMAGSEAALDRYYTMREMLLEAASRKGVHPTLTADQEALILQMRTLKDRVVACMEDDFNTAGAFGAIFEMVRESNRLVTEKASPHFASELVVMWDGVAGFMKDVLGVMGQAPADYFMARQTLALSKKGVDVSVIESLIAMRAQARQSKDFAAADRARDELDKMGIIIKDKPDGTTTWKIK